MKQGWLLIQKPAHYSSCQVGQQAGSAETRAEIDIVESRPPQAKMIARSFQVVEYMRAGSASCQHSFVVEQLRPRHLAACGVKSKAGSEGLVALLLHKVATMTSRGRSMNESTYLGTLLPLPQI